ncbi:MAG: hypothetical protein V1756_00145 [Patescibacteria group bacterium]
MPIKKSYLEQKWYFRILKVFYLILPIIVAFIFLNGKVNISDISQKSVLDLLQKNFLYIIYAVAGLVIYYAAIPKIFLYLVFGGVEDDVKSTNPAAQPAATKSAAVAPIIIIIIIIVFAALYESGYLPSIPGIHTYGSSCTNSKGEKGVYGTNGACITCSSGTAVTNPQGNCSNGVSGVYCCTSVKCVPTPCDAIGAWYCVGTYYLGGQQLQFNGCSNTSEMRTIYSSWSGSCRKCP